MDHINWLWINKYSSALFQTFYHSLWDTQFILQYGFYCSFRIIFFCYIFKFQKITRAFKDTSSIILYSGMEFKGVFKPKSSLNVDSLGIVPLQSGILMARANSTSCLSSTFRTIHGAPTIKMLRFQWQFQQRVSKFHSSFRFKYYIKEKVRSINFTSLYCLT